VFFAAQSSVNCTTNMFGFDFRQAQRDRLDSRADAKLQLDVIEVKGCRMPRNAQDAPGLPCRFSLSSPFEALELSR
jgi:hypothetical protein